MKTISDLFTLRKGQIISAGDVRLLKRLPEFTEITNPDQIVFSKFHALRYHIGSLIDAAAMQLFQAEPLLHDFAPLFLQITSTDRQQIYPPFLRKLSNLVIYYLDNTEHKKIIIDKLVQLETIWEHYQREIEHRWIEDKPFENIKMVDKRIVRLGKYLVKLKLVKANAIARLENEKNHLLGRGNFYTEYTHDGQRYFQLQLVNEQLTARQLERESKSYAYLAGLDEYARQVLLANTRPCYEKDRTGLANCALDITGHVNEDGSWCMHSITTMHSSPVPTMRDGIRTEIAAENIEQWINHATQIYFNNHPECNIEAHQQEIDALPIQLATFSVQTPVHKLLTPIADKYHNQYRQVFEVSQIIEELTDKPIKVTVIKDPQAISLFIKPTINLMVMGINQGRFVEDEELVNKINKRGFEILANNVEGYLSVNENTPQAEEIEELFATAEYLFELRTNEQDKSEQYNHHFPAIYLLLNELMGIPADAWCIDTKDRTMIIKTLAEAYRQYHLIYGEYPDIEEAADVEKLQAIERYIYLFGLFRNVPDFNGFPGTRRYVENHPLMRLGATLLGYKGSLNDRNSHLDSVKQGKAMSHLAKRQEHPNGKMFTKRSSRLPKLAFTHMPNSLFKAKPKILAATIQDQQQITYFKQKFLYTEQLERPEHCSYLMLGTGKKVVQKLLLANMHRTEVSELVKAFISERWEKNHGYICLTNDAIQSIAKIDSCDIKTTNIITAEISTLDAEVKLTENQLQALLSDPDLLSDGLLHNLDNDGINIKLVQAYAIAAGYGFRLWRYVTAESEQLSLTVEVEARDAKPIIDILDSDDNGRYVALKPSYAPITQQASSTLTFRYK